MRGIAQLGAILRNAWKQCSNSKYGIGVKIGEVWELGVIVLHHFDMTEGGKERENAKHEEISQKNHDFDIPTPNTALMVILTVNGSVGDQVGDSPMVPTAKHSLFALKPAHIA